MLIIDSSGKYEIKVDTDRFIVYEKNIGCWSSDDISRYNNEYMDKIFPFLRGREWFKCTDVRKYELSNISDGMSEHNALCVENGLFGAVMIVDNEGVKMQINNSVVYSGMIFSPIAFTYLEDAEKWLSSHWI